jgi:pimeloyl-ACP methyl ester carboxylesterase
MASLFFWHSRRHLEAAPWNLKGSAMHAIHYRYATVDGQRLFYREAGAADAPAIVLLHGFPASSFMFRDLIPLLADRYHVIAPDHLGFGLSDAPPAGDFGYTFDALAALTAGLLRQAGVTRYAMLVQDYGAPVGWRLALNDPEAVTAIITQNGNGYEVGFIEDFWKLVRELWRDRNPQTEGALRQVMTMDAIRWLYLQGVPDESLVSPETWEHDFALVSRPGNDLVQLALFADYATNLPLYPRLHAWLRAHPVPLLAVWGRNDPTFAPEGALAFAADAPGAEICLLDGGHFLLESHLHAAAGIIRGFLARALP